METLGIKAKEASSQLALLTEFEKNRVLKMVINALQERTEEILNANAMDLRNAHSANIKESLIDRLMLNESRIKGMIEGLNQLIDLEDPIGKIVDTKSLNNGIEIKKIIVPIGVVGIIYESRPNVTVDAFGLCFKSGNATILKGGKEAINTNIALENIIQDCLESLGYKREMIQLIHSTDRETTYAMMKMRKYIDVLIPRGSASLIKSVVENSQIPVIETGSGNCHIYVEKSANLDIALAIIKNAKTQRLGVCNAMESLVVDQDIAEAFIPKLINHIPNVEYRGDAISQSIDSRILKASNQDFYEEYLDLIMSVKVVSDITEAIQHINEHNTMHSEAIITEDPKCALKFQKEIDAAAVYVNASTRFTDGYEFGLGAEIGISTQKLHARGPMGLDALTSYKYIINGSGQIRQ